MRRRRKGYPAIPNVGYKTAKATSGRIYGLIPVMINTLADLEKIKSGQGAILSSRLGAKKRLEIIKKAETMKIKIINLNKGAKKWN